MNAKRTFKATETEPSSDLEHYADLGRRLATWQLRAQAWAASLASACRGIVAPLRVLGARLARWRRQRQTYHALMRCNARVLADIGIERDEIPRIARKINRETLARRKAPTRRPRPEPTRAPNNHWSARDLRTQPGAPRRRRARRLHLGRP
jgi:uncharacterized protein YjiS (DUF1127 family)